MRKLIADSVSNNQQVRGSSRFLRAVYLLHRRYWKNKAVKHSVHIPCWDSFKLNPYLWRGACFGRWVAGPAQSVAVVR
jgi:hypothetical protein